MTEVEAFCVLRANAETIVTCYEPLDMMHDPFSVVDLIQGHPGIGKFIPNYVYMSTISLCL